MASPFRTTNQETPLLSMYFLFPPHGDVGPPLMTTLSLPGLTIGLPVWLFFSPVIPFNQLLLILILHRMSINLMLIPLLLH